MTASALPVFSAFVGTMISTYVDPASAARDGQRAFIGPEEYVATDAQRETIAALGETHGRLTLVSGREDAAWLCVFTSDADAFEGEFGRVFPSVDYLVAADGVATAQDNPHAPQRALQRAEMSAKAPYSQG